MHLRSGRSMSTPNTVKTIGEPVKTIGEPVKSQDKSKTVRQTLKDLRMVKKSLEDFSTKMNSGIAERDAPVKIQDKSPILQTVEDQCMAKKTRMDEWSVKMKACFTKYDHPENQNFYGNIVAFRNTFEVILEYFEDIKIYKNILSTAQVKINHWRTETPLRLFKHVLDNDIPNVEEVLEEIRKTNIAINAVADKLGLPKQE